MKFFKRRRPVHGDQARDSETITQPVEEKPGAEFVIVEEGQLAEGLSTIASKTLTSVYEMALYARLLADMDKGVMTSASRRYVGSEVSLGSLEWALEGEDDYVFVGSFGIPLLERQQPVEDVMSETVESKDEEVRDNESLQRDTGQIKRIPGSDFRSSNLLKAVGFAYGLKKQNCKEIVIAVCDAAEVGSPEFSDALNFAVQLRLPVLVYCVDRFFEPDLSKLSRKVFHGGGSEFFGDDSLFKVVSASDPVQIVEEVRRTREVVSEERRPMVVVSTLKPRQDVTGPGKGDVQGSTGEVLDPLSVLENSLLVAGLLSAIDIVELRQKLQPLGDDYSDVQQLKDSKNFHRISEPNSSAVTDEDFPKTEAVSGAEGYQHRDEVETSIGTFSEALEGVQNHFLERDDRGVVLAGWERVEPDSTRAISSGVDVDLERQRNIRIPLAAYSRTEIAVGMSMFGEKPIVVLDDFEHVDFALEQLEREVLAARQQSIIFPRLSILLRVRYGPSQDGDELSSVAMSRITSRSPEIVVLAPSTPSDAVGLFNSAVDERRPVIFVENRQAYSGVKGEIPAFDYRVNIGQAEIIGRGSDLTIVTCGLLRHFAHSAAQALHDVARIEVVDLRSLNPLDVSAVLESVARCSKILIVSEDTQGFGAQVAQIVADGGFWSLDAPVRQLTGVVAPSSIPDNFLGYRRRISQVEIEKAAVELLRI